MLFVIALGCGIVVGRAARGDLAGLTFRHALASLTTQLGERRTRRDMRAAMGIAGSSGGGESRR